MRKGIVMKLKVMLLAICLYSMSAFSYSYTALSMMTGKNTFALNPFLYFDGTGAAGEDIFLAYGMTEKSDIWSHISLLKTAEGTFVDFSGMVRYDLGKNNIVALRASQWYVAPQYHFIYENDRFGFQANVVAQIAFDYYRDPAVFAILCPLVKLFDGKMDLFVEFNPGYYQYEGDFANLAIRSEGFEFDVVPGIGIPIGNTLVSLSCPIYNVLTNATPTFGMWWWCPITVK